MMQRNRTNHKVNRSLITPSETTLQHGNLKKHNKGNDALSRIIDTFLQLIIVHIFFVLRSKDEHNKDNKKCDFLISFSFVQ